MNLPPIAPGVLDDRIRHYLDPDDAKAILADPDWPSTRGKITNAFQNDLVDIGDMLRVTRNNLAPGDLAAADSPAAGLHRALTGPPVIGD